MCHRKFSGGRRPVACRALQPGVDRGHNRSLRFCSGRRGFSAPVHVAIAALAGGGPKFGWRELDRGFLSKQLAAKSPGSHLVDVRFGSLADISQRNRHVRFTPIRKLALSKPVSPCQMPALIVVLSFCVH